MSALTGRVVYRLFDLAEHVAELATPEQVREFVTLLSSDKVNDAILTHTERPRVETLIPDEDDPNTFLTVPDHSVIVGVHGDRGALSYQGNDGHGTEPVHFYSRGDGPEQPVLYETDEFPPRCEVTIDTIRKALIEFLRTAKRPVTLTWQPAHDSAHQ
ncbi:Imm1 family immunity protein [Saccharopolyspora pogona]|uniref:Imm1 family immunity protein n=1 Tax=Saccharopolyspora pogona TaxID=333966 RepID=UPI001689365B|nr:Imm1 family immunity protein [Saccharopolyspora pogona]